MERSALHRKLRALGVHEPKSTDKNITKIKLLKSIFILTRKAPYPKHIPMSIEEL